MPAIKYAAPAIADKLNLPAFTLGHLKYVLANAYLEADPVQDGSLFPVLVFSHGWEGFKEQNIYQVEELASNGYVVMGISHTYGSMLTLLSRWPPIPPIKMPFPRCQRAGLRPGFEYPGKTMGW